MRDYNIVVSAIGSQSWKGSSHLFAETGTNEGTATNGRHPH